MSLSRKRRKELKRLRGSAEQLWGEQQAVLERANTVAREASRQLGQLTREEVTPRVREGYETYLQPRVNAVGRFAGDAGRSIERTMVPVLGSALGTVMSIGDIAKDKRVRAALARVNPKAEEPKSGPGVGGYIAIGAAVVAAGAIAYAVWQTFRADDELWVAEDEPTPGPDKEA
ncbi:hypothetical protein [Agromyces sp. SYSU T00194]|uniref:hypothetical protein n=1 Tax=Agromyces chitinivorans TaxID=3158560 RepID=UPI003391C434